ncbi:amino acid adenylation domain-containing protein, partial [Pseudoalteromonas sp. MMG013]|uniref:non-ribosomal peptide synthetase n=1 Tax=Pseudoalteromonas sp. MMG013 TaxID=2822687 RepID=UPI001B382084
NFFELGGDSILGIQVISKTHQYGLNLSVRELFQYQSVKALSDFIRSKPTELPLTPCATSEPFALSPMQAWFYSQRFQQPEHFNQSQLIKVQSALSSAQLQMRLQMLLEHHDVFSLDIGSDSLPTQQVYTTNRNYAQQIILLDLSAVSSEQQFERVEQECQQIQMQLDLEQGILWQVCLFYLGHGEHYVFLCSHHLLIDGVSWHILLEDITTLLGSNSHEALAAKTHSFQQWVNYLNNWNESQEGVQQLAYWCNLAAKLPKAVGNAKAEARDKAHISSLSWQVPVTQLTGLCEVGNSDQQSLLLGAFSSAFSQIDTHEYLLMNLEGHGRDVPAPLNLSRTVGWFTSMVPLLIDCRSNTNFERHLDIVNQAVADLPPWRNGYGVLRYSQNIPELADIKPKVVFNFLGTVHSNKASDGATEQPVIERVNLANVSDIASTNIDEHHIALNLVIIHGNLQCQWRYRSDVYQHRDIEKIQSIFTSLLSNSVRVSNDEIQPSEPRKLPLTPLQQGIFFHSLYAPSAVIYHIHLGIDIGSRIDYSLLNEAWRIVKERHDMLNMVFRLHQDQTPYQMRAAESEQSKLQHNDLSLCTEHEAKAQLLTLIEQDKQSPFELMDRVPMTLRLVQLPTGRAYLSWTYHHLLLDGWSTSIVLSELIQAYSALVSQSAVGLPVVATQFANYVDYIEQHSTEQIHQYWQNYLAGVSEPTVLPIVSNEEVSTAPSAHTEYKITLSDEQTSGLRAFAQAHRVTLNTVVQGAWAALISSYSNELDVVFGATVSGRSNANIDLQSLVGVTINTLPVRVKLSLENAVSDWLQKIQEHQAEHLNYETSPLVDIQRYSEVSNASTLFNSIVVFENYPIAQGLKSALTDINIDGIDVHERTHYPISLMVVPKERLEMTLVVNQQILSQSIAKEMAQSLELILKNLPKKDTVLALLQVTSPNVVNAEEPDQKVSTACVLDMVYEQAVRYPSRHAISGHSAIGQAQVFYYNTLMSSVEQLAQTLAANGVTSGDVVAIQLPRTPQTVVVMLALWRVGAAYLPIEIDAPTERVEFMLKDSGAVFVVQSQGSVRSQLQFVGTRLLLEELIAQPVVSRTAFERKSFDTNKAAYIIYTSGTTGHPKGVEVSHRALAIFLNDMRKRLRVTEQDKLLAVTTYCFDISILELFLPLICGAQVVLLSSDQMQNGASLATQIDAHDITFMQATPATWHLLLESNWSGKPDLIALCGGEFWSMELGRKLDSKVAQLWNMYGPTEATIWVAASEVDTKAEKVFIDGTVEGASLHVLSRAGLPVPEGGVGKLFIGGDTLANGYRNNPQLTEERFLPNHSYLGRRLYDTGDLARIMSEGRIQFLGREDDQIKLRGYRLELGEIESTILKHESVARVAIVIKDPGFASATLVAYLVMYEQCELDTVQLSEFASQFLPGYMIPSLWFSLDALPLNSNNKVDKKLLVARQDIRQLERSRTAAKSKTQQSLLQCWAEVLACSPDEISIHDNFFDIGGNSLLMAKLGRKITNEFGREIGYMDLFNYPSIALFSHFIDAEPKAESIVQVDTSRAVKKRQALAQQQRMNRRRK